MRTLIFFILITTSCTHLASVSTTTIPANRNKKVAAESYRFIFLALNFDNDYVETIVRDLARQCRKGKVEGILTKHESITYFPVIAHAVRISAQGYCTHQNKRSI